MNANVSDYVCGIGESDVVSMKYLRVNKTNEHMYCKQLGKLNDSLQHYFNSLLDHTSFPPDLDSCTLK